MSWMDDRAVVTVVQNEQPARRPDHPTSAPYLISQSSAAVGSFVATHAHMHTPKHIYQSPGVYLSMEAEAPIRVFTSESGYDVTPITTGAVKLAKVNKYPTIQFFCRLWVVHDVAWFVYSKSASELVSVIALEYNFCI